MKTNFIKTISRVESRKSKVECQPDAGPQLLRPRPSTLDPRPGFTLIELLVVIAIMGVLAGLTLSVLGGVKRSQALNTARAEMDQIKTALDNYKAKYGVYPPGNSTSSLQNQLYYELSGTTNDGTYFITLDGSSQIKIGDVFTAFGVGGFINCSKGGGEDAAAAHNFLPSLKPNRLGTSTFNGISITNLVTSVRGPDANYQPLGVPDVNPFRYAYPGTNNPGSYDLWVQLVYHGQTNLICNWSRQVLINSPLP